MIQGQNLPHVRTGAGGHLLSHGDELERSEMREKDNRCLRTDIY